MPPASIEGSSLALEMFWEVRGRFSLEPVIDYAFKEGFVAKREAAYEPLIAALQWMTCQVTALEENRPFAMMNGEVNDLYSALRQHDMCTSEKLLLEHQHVGQVYFNYRVLSGSESAQADHDGTVDYTLKKLQDAFKTDLAPALHTWIAKRDKGQLRACGLSSVHADRRTEAVRKFG